MVGFVLGGPTKGGGGGPGGCARGGADGDSVAADGGVALVHVAGVALLGIGAFIIPFIPWQRNEVPTVQMFGMTSSMLFRYSLFLPLLYILIL